MIPNWLQAVVLGVVQGLTEFAPVSSSGHLVLVPYFFGWERPGLAFDVALHGGTAGAIVVYFRGELLAMARGVLTGGRTAEGRLYRRLAGLFVIASVPVAIVGLTLRGVFEEAFATPPVAAAFLFLTAAILFGGERWRTRRVRLAAAAAPEPPDPSPGAPAPDPALRTAGTTGHAPGGAGQAAATGALEGSRLPLGADPADPAGRTLDQIGVRHALLIGAAQCLALFPGVSRSGTTIMAGVAAGLTRQAATRFSFLLLLPALVGAGIVSLPDLAQPDVYTGWEIAGGVAAAAVASYVAIAFLVAFVSRQRLSGFALYCLVVGALGLGTFLLTG